MFRDYRSIIERGYVWSKGFAAGAAATGGQWHIVSSTERILPAEYYKKLSDQSCSSYWIKAGSHAKRCSIDNLALFVENTLPFIEWPFDLITSDGDSSLVELIQQSGGDAVLLSPWLRSWRAQNAQDLAFVANEIDTSLHAAYREKTECLPIGLDLHTERGIGVGHSILNALELAISKQSQRVPQILVDCCINQTSQERTAFCRGLKRVPEISLLSSRLSQRRLWDMYRSHVAVLSLPGFGIDCHRTWEAGYLGAVPVVINRGLGAPYRSFGIQAVSLDHYERVNWSSLLEEVMEVSKQIVGLASG